jgi:hypothetical protein
MIPVPEVRTCRNCEQRLPIDVHHFAVNGPPRRDGVQGYRRTCRRCQARQSNERQKRLRRDPELGPEFRVKAAAWKRDWARRNPERSHAIQKRYRDKQMADPELHARLLDRIRRYYHERPDYREKRLHYMRARYWREKRIGLTGWTDEPDYEAATSNSPRVSTQPLLALLAETFPGADSVQIAAALDWDYTHARRVIEGEYRHICLHVVDRLVTEGLGRPDLLGVLYPYEDPS